MEPSDKTDLYFIALFVHGELAEKIRTIQLYCSETYQSKKALRSPPHVTLIPPFRDNDSIENILDKKLTPFFGKYHSFKVELNGFSKFGARTIFIEPLETPPVIPPFTSCAKAPLPLRARIAVMSILFFILFGIK